VQSQGSFVELTRTNDNFFEKTFGSQLSFPITIQMTNIFGETLNDVIQTLDNDNPQNGQSKKKILFILKI
jgi:expansin (peptidoglycan-binding protein)